MKLELKNEAATISAERGSTGVVTVSVGRSGYDLCAARVRLRPSQVRALATFFEILVQESPLYVE